MEPNLLVKRRCTEKSTNSHRGPGGSMSYVVGLPKICDQVYQLFNHGRWFSPGTPASSTTKAGHHDIAEILLKVALKHHK
jgi:hypothetical protein